jgi:hypothetical protein
MLLTIKTIMNTKENNRLIAEFMGEKTITIDELKSILKENRENGLIHTPQAYVEDDLKYHSSWDWLMPVVSKCREESNEEDSHWEAIYYSLEGCDINVTYQAVVEFIKQYNNQ